MKLLVFDADEAGSQQLAVALRREGRELIRVADDTAAMTTLVRGGPQLLVLVARKAFEPLFKVARQARSLPLGNQLGILLLADGLSDAQLLEGYEVGVDADLSLMASPRLLELRVQAFERLVSGVRKPLVTSAPAPAPAAAVTAAAAPAASGASGANGASVAPVELTPLERVVRAAVWREVSKQFQTAAGKFLTLGVSMAPPPTAQSAFANASRILLSNVEQELELAVTLGANTHSGSALAVHLFGPGSDGMAPDVLSELSNIFMGTLKTGFSAEKVHFVGGLPQVVAVDEVLRPTQTFKYQEVFALSMGDATVVVHLGLRSKANQLLTPGLLREGMVIAKDVMNARGLMLLTKNTRLSANMIDRLMASLAKTAQVEVMAS